MKCKLTPQLSSDDWKDFCSRFHFSPADLPYIKAIYTALLPLVESCAYYSLDQNLDGIFLPHYAYGFVTLGNGIDELSELYLDHEQIQEAYIVDCVSLLLLSNSFSSNSSHIVCTIHIGQSLIVKVRPLAVGHQCPKRSAALATLYYYIYRENPITKTEKDRPVFLSNQCNSISSLMRIGVPHKLP